MTTRLPPPSTDEAFAAFMRLLREAGLRRALAYLLELTDYRYIAIFRFRDELITAIAFYDREDPAAEAADIVPVSATYCCFVRDSKGAFTTADSLLDARVAGHVKRETVKAYHGIPILTPEGEILGTLCHFDDVPRDPEQIDLELILQVASALEQTGSVPAFPDVDVQGGAD